MRMKKFARICGMTLVGMLALVGGLGFGPQVQADGSHAKYEGTWMNDVQILACAPAPPIVFASFQSLTTHMIGGTLLESGAAAGPPPGVSRSPGQGIWQQTSARRFVEFFQFSNFDNLGRLVSIVEVTVRVRLIHGDNPATAGVVEPYYLKGEGTNRITNLNPVDGSVINVTEGCNRATSAPMLFED